MAIKYTTPVFRASYANVWEPKEDDKGKEFYSICMIFSKEPGKPNSITEAQFTELKKCIQSALAEKWGKDQTKWPRQLKICLRDADQEDRTDSNAPNFDENYVKSHFINARTFRKPGIVDENVAPIIDPEDFYSGCYARATVVFSAYDNVSRGVGCYLNNLMKVGDGNRLGGAPPADVDFARFKSTTDAESDFTG